MIPKISIVLVNYNYSRYLDERIQSFLDQTYKDFELIIIDNGSTDDSQSIINKYKTDSRIKIQFYPENISPYKRWNFGADMAQGEYLLIASSDDSCHAELLEKLTQTLDSYPSVGLAFSQSWAVDDEGRKLNSWKEWTDDLNKERWAEDFVDEGRNECQYLFFKCTIPNSGAVLMRRKIFIEAGKFDEKMQLSADWMLWVKMLTISDIAFVSKPLNYFRSQHSNMRSSTKKAVELEEKLQVIHYLNQRLKPPESFWKTVYNSTLEWWVRLVLYEKMPLTSSQRVYKLLSDIDPDLNYRLLSKFFELLKRKIDWHLFGSSSST